MFTPAMPVLAASWMAPVMVPPAATLMSCAGTAAETLSETGDEGGSDGTLLALRLYEPANNFRSYVPCASVIAAEPGTLAMFLSQKSPRPVCRAAVTLPYGPPPVIVAEPGGLTWPVTS